MCWREGQLGTVEWERSSAEANPASLRITRGSHAVVNVLTGSFKATLPFLMGCTHRSIENVTSVEYEIAPLIDFSDKGMFYCHVLSYLVPTVTCGTYF